MPTKDAVIVNAPRELEVPTFSKQEIIKFVGDADEASDYEEVIALVNEGLQKGDIVVEGGIKLYKHEVVLSISGITGNVDVTIIATSQNPCVIQGGPPIPRIPNGIIVVVYLTHSAGYFVFSRDDNAIYGMSTRSGAGLLEQTYDFVGATLVSDTVTEL